MNNDKHYICEKLWIITPDLMKKLKKICFVIKTKDDYQWKMKILNENFNRKYFNSINNFTRNIDKNSVNSFKFSSSISRNFCDFEQNETFLIQSNTEF